MVSLDKAIIAHHDVGGERFEILVDPKLAEMYRTGQKKEINNVLAVEEVFKNYRRGDRHKSSDLEKAFDTTDIFRIADIILKKGEIQLTTDQRREKFEERKKQIITILAREAIDPRTDAPHTRQRIENALEQAKKVNIDPMKDAESQIEDIVKALRPIIPLKFKKIRVAAKIPPEYAQRIYGTIKNYGIQKEEWTSTGSLIVVIEIPAGMQAEFYDKLNNMTSGNVETKVVE